MPLARRGFGAVTRRGHRLTTRLSPLPPLSCLHVRDNGCPTSHSVARQRRSVATDRLSIRTGPSEPPLIETTIPEHFASIVSNHGDRPAIIARDPTFARPPSTSSTASSAAPTSSPDQYVTYYDLDVLSNRLASSLASLGVRKGDRVAVSLGNGVPFAALTYALFKLGAVLVPLNPTFNAAQVAAALSHLSAKVLVVGAVTDLAYRPGKGRSNEELIRAVAGDISSASSSSSSSSPIDSEAVPSLQAVVVVDNRGSHPDVRFDLDACKALTPYRSLLEGYDRAVTPESPLAATDTINIQFTSGTTSTPKAAMLTHRSILNNGALIASRMGLDPSDRVVVPPPLFHCFGCILGYMATATTGAAICFPSPAFDPAATLRMCVDLDATGLYGVSTMFLAVLELLDAQPPLVAHPPRSLRKGIAAGSSMPESLMARIYGRLGLDDLVNCYGMTETSPVSCMTVPSDPYAQRIASIGRPMPHTTVKIVDPADRRRVLPVGERGELAASGYLVMRGYYGDEARTAEARVSEADPGGDGSTVWMYSGDEADMDPDGYVRITGRIKDLIIRGGENIHPLEVEDCLLRLPGVRDVSVVGVHDDKLGEAVAAFVIPKGGWSTDAAAGPEQQGMQAKQDNESNEGSEPDKGSEPDRVGQPKPNTEPKRGDDAKPQANGEEAVEPAGALTKLAVQAWVRAQLSSHLVPKHVFWLSEFPKTASGKVQKFKLKQAAGEMLAAQSAVSK